MKAATKIIHTGRAPEKFDGLVNIPACRTSTYLYKSVSDFFDAANSKEVSLYYGRFGNQTSHALEDALAMLDMGDGAVLYPSGLSAITMVMSTFLKSGD